jgi:hypothetical protein
MKLSVLIHDDFWFMYISDPGGKPSPNSCFLMTPLHIRTWCINWHAELQHPVTVALSLISPAVKTWTILDPYSVIAESGFFVYLYATFINVENISRCVRKVIFGHYFLQFVKKKIFRTVLRFIPQALANDRASAWRTLISGFLRKKKKKSTCHILQIQFQHYNYFKFPFLQQVCMQWHEQFVCVGQNLLLKVSECVRRFDGFYRHF